MDLEEKISDTGSSLEKYKESVKSSFDDLRDFISSVRSDESFQRYIFTSSLILVLVLAGFLVFSDSSVTPSYETHVVEFTDRGFDPIVLEIDRGDTVRFVDNASISMWVASDPFPKNSRYSNTTKNEHCENGSSTIEAFDQCSIGPEFEFKFEKTGEWGYHNQKPFASGGRITVVR